MQTEGLKCPICGYETIEGARMAEFRRLVADEYRKEHGLLTSTQIRSLRKSLGMNQEEFAGHLGVGIASVKRWEMGKIQDRRSNDCIIREVGRGVGTAREWTNGTMIIVNSADTFVGGKVEATGMAFSDFKYDVVIQPYVTNIALNQSGLNTAYGCIGTIPTSYLEQQVPGVFSGQAVWCANEDLLSSKNENQGVLADAEKNPQGLRHAA